MIYYCSTLDGRIGFKLDDYIAHQADLKAGLVEVFLGGRERERLIISYDNADAAKKAAREISESIEMQTRTKRDHELALAEKKAEEKRRRRNEDEE